MATRASSFEEHLLCPVCREIFRDPVLLLCSHSFCLHCLEQYWAHTSSQKCPVCRADFCLQRPPCNRALKNLCESVLQEKKKPSEIFCSLHGERPELFCLEDQQLLCRVCLKADLHIKHTCTPLDETARAVKEKLKTNLKSLHEQFRLLKFEKFLCEQRAKRTKNQAQQTEADIREEFERLHRFLREEEEATITALKEEEEQKMKILDEQIQKINSQLLSLIERIKGTEEEMESTNISLLLNYSGTCGRAQCAGTCLDKLPDVFIDVAKHLGNLKFRVWQKMAAVIQYTPVVLDPSTAHPCLQLSGDLTAVRFGKWSQQALGYPETVEARYTSVLGSEGFRFGTHYWDVHVGDNTSWALGIISESAIKRRDDPPSSGLWQIAYHKGTYGRGVSGEVLTPLALQQTVQRIRVHLNWESGKLSFLNLLTNTHIHTFTHTFTERLFPYFCNVCPSQALRILPVETSVTGTVEV